VTPQPRGWSPSPASRLWWHRGAEPRLPLAARATGHRQSRRVRMDTPSKPSPDTAQGGFPGGLRAQGCGRSSPSSTHRRRGSTTTIPLACPRPPPLPSGCDMGGTCSQGSTGLLAWSPGRATPWRYGACHLVSQGRQPHSMPGVRGNSLPDKAIAHTASPGPGFARSSRSEGCEATPRPCASHGSASLTLGRRTGRTRGAPLACSAPASTPHDGPRTREGTQWWQRGGWGSRRGDSTVPRVGDTVGAGGRSPQHTTRKVGMFARPNTRRKV
jgi:hypothetical protein